ncbi:MAG TPA: hypothetical protein VHR16_03365 [Candidatus Limnocylindrales bacterium]|nr:hypothetical protein [Candidatus Limnocylindrales bacterium]
MGGGRRLGSLLLGTVLATLVAWSPLAAQPALAAGPLGVQAATTYTVDPRDAAVHVAIAYTVTNNKPNSSTIIYFYRTLRLGIQPGARSIRAADGVGALGVSSTPHKAYTEVSLNLRANLYYGRTTSFTLRYALPGGKPRSTSPIRVGRAFVTFGVWAFGDPGDASVTVRMPAGFTTTVDGDDMSRSGGASGTVLRASPASPDSFFAVVTGEDAAAYDDHHLSLPGGADVVVLSWPEDKQWETSVSSTLETGFPELEKLVGLDWPVTHALNVRERYTPALEGYAGLFFSDDQRIDVSEDIDPVTILHEASHAWFNADLFADRWIYEGLAEEYTWQVLTATGGDPQPLPSKPSLADPGWQALISWTFPKVIRDQDTSDEERYGYQASFWVVHRIVSAAGVDAMRQAFETADANTTAYPGAGPPETVPAKDDWRRFLDLVEPIDKPDAASVEDAMRDVVTTTLEAQALALRTRARADYRELVAAGDGWVPPWYVRQAMGDWLFQDATARMEDATAVLALRDQALAAASGEGLRFDTTDIEAAYEGATDGFAMATSETRTALAAVEAIAGAHAFIDAPLDPIAQLGLLGETPRSGYEAARAAFEAGDADAAITDAQQATRVLTSATARGQERLVMGGIVVVSLAGFLVLIVVLRRRRCAAPLGIQPGTAAFLAMDARFAPDAVAPDAVAPDAAAPAVDRAPTEPEPLGASGTLGAHPEPPPRLVEASPDVEGGSDST